MLANEGVRDRVVVPIGTHQKVVVDADLGALEGRELIARQKGLPPSGAVQEPARRPNEPRRSNEFHFRTLHRRHR